MRSCREPVPASIRILVAALATIVVVVAGVTSAGAQGSDPDAPVSSEQARAAVRDVMARPEFDYSPSTLERISEWIGEQLSKLFAPAETAAGGSFGGGIGTLFGWLIMLAAVAALVAVAVWVIAKRSRRERGEDEEPLSPTEVEHRRRADEWRSDAERLESQGRWKEALRARYRHLVRVLVDRHQLPDVPGRTTGELRGDLAATTPDAVDEFDTCCLLFELAWYADVPTDAEGNSRFRAAAELVLAAPAGVGGEGS